MKVKTITYEARLNKRKVGFSYGTNTYYKKGLLIEKFSEKTFNKLTLKNIDDYTDLCICEGHGVYEYFDLKDIDFIKVTKIITYIETKVKLKQ